jgi:hypothetical protein
LAPSINLQKCRGALLGDISEPLSALGGDLGDRIVESSSDRDHEPCDCSVEATRSSFSNASSNASNIQPRQRLH